MARKPFDPSRALGGLFDAHAATSESAAGPSKPLAVLAVSALSHLIRTTLEGTIGKVAVAGEISNFREVQGHWYFTLKDPTARIDAMMFRSAAQRVSCNPVDGMAVIAIGEITHYPPQGRTQIQCSSIEPAGAGGLDAQFRALCTELRALGYFDPARKVAIPSAPMCIALVTSAKSAAEADCLDAAARTFPATRVIAVDVRVQGASAAASIAATIDAIDAAAHMHGIEVILLVRGGGSLEDLWAFNERIVADAILRCKTPLVTGIGHESDTTIADLVADLRAATPSRAVTEVLPRRDILVEQLDALSRRLLRAMSASLQQFDSALEVAVRSRQLTDPRAAISARDARVSKCARRLVHDLSTRVHEGDTRLSRTATRLQQHHPAARIATANARLDGARATLQRVERSNVQRAADRLDAVSRTLEAIGPMTVLERGYSITLDSAGRALRDANAVTEGSRLETLLAHGTLSSTVVTTTH